MHMCTEGDICFSALRGEKWKKKAAVTDSKQNLSECEEEEKSYPGKLLWMSSAK